MFCVFGQKISSHSNIFHVATTKESKAFSMQTQTTLGAFISKNLKTSSTQQFKMFLYLLGWSSASCFPLAM
jgi:hypothetical protein